MSLEECARKRSWPNCRYVFGRAEKDTKCLTTASVSADIRIGHPRAQVYKFILRYIYIYIYIYIYTGYPRRNVPDFGRVFLMLKYTDITQNTYVQS